MSSDLFGNDTDSLFLSDTTSRRCKVHPVVVFNVLDHHARRPADASRVIGALLGVVSPSGDVDVRDSFPVPHTESGKVAVDMQYHRTMLALHARAAPALQVVGWYSSSAEVSETSVMFHGFFVRECQTAPVHLTVDTALAGAEPKLRVDAYLGVSLTLGETVGSLFVPMETRISLSESEKIGLHMVARAVAPLPLDAAAAAADATPAPPAAAPDAAPPAADGEPGATPAALSNVNVTALLARLKAQLERLHAYASGVAAGERRGDAAVGAALFDAIHALPAMSVADFSRVFNSSVDDVLMISYLAKLSRTQLALAEQIEKI